MSLSKTLNPSFTPVLLAREGLATCPPLRSSTLQQRRPSDQSQRITLPRAQENMKRLIGGAAAAGDEGRPPCRRRWGTRCSMPPGEVAERVKAALAGASERTAGDQLWRPRRRDWAASSCD